MSLFIRKLYSCPRSSNCNSKRTSLTIVNLQWRDEVELSRIFYCVWQNIEPIPEKQKSLQIKVITYLRLSSRLLCFSIGKNWRQFSSIYLTDIIFCISVVPVISYFNALYEPWTRSSASVNYHSSILNLTELFWITLPEAWLTDFAQSHREGTCNNNMTLKHSRCQVFMR